DGGRGVRRRSRNPNSCGDRGGPRCHGKADVRRVGLPRRRQHVRRRQRPGRALGAGGSCADRRPPRGAACRALRDARPCDAGLGPSRHRRRPHHAPARAVGQARRRVRALASRQAV
ncbi:MAG: FIG00825063: hypothetical protein, partial [uncultured Solirubrobacteraceae bacterium]